MSTTHSFTEWLAGQAGRDTPTGDLARDAAQDPGWPRGGTDLSTFVAHLESMGAHDAALDALRRAWGGYRRAAKRTEGG